MVLGGMAPGCRNSDLLAACVWRDTGTEKDMKRTLGLYWVYIGVILGLYRGCIGILEKEMEATIED